MVREQCVTFTPDEWEGRCIEDTPLDNHRYEYYESSVNNIIYRSVRIFPDFRIFYKSLFASKFS